MNNFKRLTLLMWKCLQFCKHYWAMTVVEICLPIILVYLVIKVSLPLIDTSPIQVPAINKTPTEVLIPSLWAYEVILYTPDTLQMKNLMEHVERFAKKHANKSIKVKAVPNENKMVMEISESKNNVSGVVVLALSRYMFHYKIRDKFVYNTSEKFYDSEYEDTSSLTDPYRSRGFLSLLAALNMVYAGDSSSSLKPTYAPFPSPAYTLSSSRAVLPKIVGFVVVLTSLILSVPLLLAIISEKECGMKELMKIVGVPEKLLWLSWFLSWLIIDLIVCTGITYLLRIDFIGTKGAAFSHVHASILWTGILLFYIAQIAFSFMLVALFQTVVLAIPSLFVVSITMGYMAYQFHKWRNSIFVHLSCLLPAGAFMQGVIRFAHYEEFGVALKWKSLFTMETNVADASVGFVFLLLIFDAIVCLFLTYYISAINPSQYGFDRVPLFKFVQVSVERYKNRHKKSTVDQQNSQSTEEVANPIVEPPSPGAEVSLKLENLQKNFGYVESVRDVNLTVYKDEILVLLGHDGSGKTTILSMMAGLTKPTNGQILFRGNIDLLKNMKEFRKNLGVCLQKNSLFPYLTVMDHLLFFGMLKGATEKEAEDEAKVYLKLMDFETNADEIAAIISKGVERKLSFSIALMGKADVLILDEPTADLNPQSKQNIWDLLLKLKSNRTVILTSQFMNEAEIYADRIAIMNHGVIVASGSSDFLKRTFGVGYYLKLMRKRVSQINPKMKDVTPQLITLITKTVPGSRLETRSATELVFSLPSQETARFSSLFRNIDSKKSTFSIERVVLSGSTLEQVFHKLGGESVYDSEGKLLTPSSVVEDPTVLSMFKTSYIDAVLMNALEEVVLPTMLMILMIRGTTRFDYVDPPLELTLEGAYPNALVMILKNRSFVPENYEFMNKFVNYLHRMGAQIKFTEGANLKTVMLAYATESLISYRRDLILANTFPHPKNSSQIDSYYNRWARHAFPAALTAVENTKIHLQGHKEERIIIPINHPVKPVNVSLLTDKFNIQEQSPILWIWFILMAFFTIDLLDYFVIPVKVERLSGFKQIQLLSSVSLRTYWINNFVSDFNFFFIIILLRILVLNAFDAYGIFSFKRDLLIVFLIISLFIASGLLFMYIISFAATSKVGSYISFFLFNCICAFISFIYYKFQTALLSGSFTSSVGHMILFITKYIIMLIPPLNFSLTIEKFVMAWRVNHMVEAYAQHGLNDKQFEANNYQPYLETTSFKNPNGILEELCFMVIDIALYSGMLYVIESGIVVRYMNLKKHGTRDPFALPSNSSEIPSEVLDERNKVAILSEIMNADPTLTTENVLLVQGLQKIFERLLRRSVTAVNDATFMIRAGECFGVLGRSGAGKTTTFKMLTGEIVPTQGESWILNVKLSENRNEYFSKTGYCAETNCFLEELTGKETLNLIASLRGVLAKDREFAVNKWLSTLGLVPVENKKCGQCSGGDRRKICTALAMIGNPNIVFLDEPTSGIDPVSRRRLYNVFIQMKSAGQTIALTSRSIDECEILCDRLTILVNGEMKFIGTTDDLKQKYGMGFSLVIKLKEQTSSENDELRNEQTEVLKEQISEKFKSYPHMLKEENKSLLRYRIQHKMPLAESFQKMEELKKDVKIIAEYILTEISLEEVYLSLVEESYLSLVEESS